MVESQTELLAQSVESTVFFKDTAHHPVPYLRVYPGFALLDRLGFSSIARQLRASWERLYPKALATRLPKWLTSRFHEATSVAVEGICFTPYPQLGDKRLADVVTFGAKENAMVEEAAERLAAGIDPGIVPERFLIGAAGIALTRRRATPGVVARNFYQAMERR
jgi:hypothetical protein